MGNGLGLLKVWRTKRRKVQSVQRVRGEAFVITAGWSCPKGHWNDDNHVICVCGEHR